MLVSVAVATVAGVVASVAPEGSLRVAGHAREDRSYGTFATFSDPDGNSWLLWTDWYAAYIVAREQGRTPEEAVKDGALHMERVRR